MASQGDGSAVLDRDSEDLRLPIVEQRQLVAERRHEDRRGRAPIGPGGAHRRIDVVLGDTRPLKEKGIHTYRVRSGDTLKSIAVKVYGDASRWTDIYNANKYQIKRGNITPGQTLVIP